MKLNEIVVEMAISDISRTERELDKMFRDIGLDVQFSHHFKDRLSNNSSLGRESDISHEELLKVFSELKKKYGKQLLMARNNPKEFVGLLKDITTQLNIPFTIDYDKIYNGLHKLKAITVMRKKHFGSDNFGNEIFSVRT